MSARLQGLAQRVLDRRFGRAQRLDLLPTRPPTRRHRSAFASAPSSMAAGLARPCVRRCECAPPSPRRCAAGRAGGWVRSRVVALVQLLLQPALAQRGRLDLLHSPTQRSARARARLPAPPSIPLRHAVSRGGRAHAGAESVFGGAGPCLPHCLREQLELRALLRLQPHRVRARAWAGVGCLRALAHIWHGGDRAQGLAGG
jgi:hypothetical protein